MKVKIKFSDLRKLKDEKRYLKEKLEESNLKLDYAITNEKNLISEIKQKNNKLDDLTQEIKELNEENNVLSAENNRLKSLAGRKMPKFWFGDRVRYAGGKVVNRINYIEYNKETGHFYYPWNGTMKDEKYFSLAEETEIKNIKGDDEK